MFVDFSLNQGFYPPLSQRRLPLAPNQIESLQSVFTRGAENILVVQAVLQQNYGLFISNTEAKNSCSFVWGIKVKVSILTSWQKFSLRSHFDQSKAPLLSELQEILEKVLHVEVNNESLEVLRSTWRKQPSLISFFDSSRVNLLQYTFKDSPPPVAETVTGRIYDLFKVKVSHHFFYRYREDLGFPGSKVKPKQSQSTKTRAKPFSMQLSEQQIERLQGYFEGKEASANKIRQAINDLFGLQVAKSYVYKNKDRFGIPFQVRHISKPIRLSEDVKKRIKDHFANLPPLEAREVLEEARASLGLNLNLRHVSTLFKEEVIQRKNELSTPLKLEDKVKICRHFLGKKTLSDRQITKEAKDSLNLKFSKWKVTQLRKDGILPKKQRSNDSVSISEGSFAEQDTASALVQLAKS